VHPVSQDHFAPSSQTVREVLRDQLKSCHAAICLVGRVYGHEPRRWADGPRRSYTQLEYDIARELGMPVFSFLASESCPLAPHPPEAPDEQALQVKHREAIENDDHAYFVFDDLPTLTRLVARIRFDELRQGQAKRRGILHLWLLGAGIAVLGVAASVALPIALKQSASRDGQASESLPPNSPSTSTPLSLELNKSNYAEGDLLELTITLARPGYLYVGAVWANGEVYLLYPNFYHPLNGENWLEAGTTLRLPRDLPATAQGAVVTYPIQFPADLSEPRVQESIFAFVTAEKLELPDLEADLGPAFRRLGVLRQEEQIRIRGPRPLLQMPEWTPDLPEEALVVQSYFLKKSQ